MGRSKGGQAITDLVLEVFRVNGRLLAAGDALTRPAGQTSARWQVLGAIDEHAASVADISRRMGLTRQSVQRIADVLEAEGLIRFEENPVHRRAQLAILTSRGRATLDEITSRQIEWANRIAARIEDNEQDLRQSLRTLQRVRDAVDDSVRIERRDLLHPKRKRNR